MNRYMSIVFSAILLVTAFFPHQLSAASITQTKAAIGDGCIASGDYSTAMGKATTASERTSTAMGNSTTASGWTSTSMGNSTTASGWTSTAVGNDTTASGWTSIALGNNTTASGWTSTSMGSSTTASGWSSTAMGYNTEASGTNSTAIGESCKAAGSVSWAGGKYMHLLATANNSFVWGHSESEQYLSEPNTFLIFPAGIQGKVGIGTKEPMQIMHIVGSNPRILVEASSSNAEVNFKNSGDANSLIWAIYKDSANNNFNFYQGGNKVTVQSVTGNFGIGTTDPGQKLDIAGGSGRVETGYNWLTNSDHRLKKNISTLEGSLEKISRLRGVRFNSKEASHLNKGDGKHIGVIAQELEKEYPELVVGDKETGYKAVAYDKLTAVLIEAVKELKTRNQTQEEVLKKQQAEIEELRSMIKEL